jgi:hypothetical protein
MNNISFFKKITDTDLTEITWPDVHALIKTDESVKLATAQLRNAIPSNRWDLHIPDHKKQYQKLKVELLSGFMPAGIFQSKVLEDLVQYSQVVHTDFDDLSLEEEEKLQAFMKAEPSVIMSFVSPGGRGRKIFHQVKPLNPITDISPEMLAEFHRTAFEQLTEVYEKNGVLLGGFDRSVSNVNRACYLSHDPDAFINHNANPLVIRFEQEEIKKKKEITTKTQQLEEWYYPNAERYMKESLNHTKKKLEVLLEWLVKNNKSITEEYSNWIRVIFALKRAFDDTTARELATRFSQLDAVFTERNFEEKFNQQIKIEKAPTLGTIFHLAKEVGYTLKDSKIPKTSFLETFIRELAKDGWKLRYNEFAGFLEVLKDDGWVRFTDRDLDVIKAGLFGHAHYRNTVQETLNVIAPSYNPIQQLVANLPTWDGVDHIAELTSTLNSKEGKWPLIFIRRWLIGLLAGLVTKNHYNENVLILQGEQGDGKTRWVRRLFTEAFSSCGLEPDLYFKQKQLDAENKDDMVLLCSSFVVFFDEMNSIVNRKADIEAFKNMTSATSHTIRKPYARYSEDLKRYASIIGTVNESQFLVDSTGNRRFWTIPVGKINQQHAVNIPQVFAQAYQLMKNGEPHYLSSAEIVELNETYLSQFEIVKTEDEMIRQCVEPSDDRMLTTTQIMAAINQLADREIIKCGAAHFGKALKKYFGDRYIQNKTGRYYRVTVRQPTDETFTFRFHEKTTNNSNTLPPPLSPELNNANELNFAGFRHDDHSYFPGMSRTKRR